MFLLNPKPTFKADVTVTVPGGEQAKITFIFKHKGRKALKAFFDNLGGGETPRPEHEALLEIVEGWEGVDGKFTPENFETLLDNYPSVGMAIFEAYNKSIFEARQKN